MQTFPTVLFQALCGPCLGWRGGGELCVKPHPFYVKPAFLRQGHLALEGRSGVNHKSLVTLKAAFEESDLPYTVDIVDLSTVSDSFKRIVESHKVRLLLGATTPRRTTNGAS